MPYNRDAETSGRTVVWEARARQAIGDPHGHAGLERSRSGEEPEVTAITQLHKHSNYLFLSKGVFFFFIIIYYYYYFPKKILLEMPLCAVTQGYLHSITHLPLPRCGEKMIRSAQRRSWMPTPASPLPGLMRRYQERGFDSSAHYNKELRVTPAAGNIEMRRPQF